MLLIVLLSVMIIINTNAFAEVLSETEVYNGIRYHINKDERWASVCGYDGNAEDLVIPSRISKGIIVSEIEGAAFDGCSSIKVLEIPDTIMKIDETAFLGMDNLKFVVSNTSGVNIVVKEDVKIVLKRSELESASESPEETKAPDVSDTTQESKSEAADVIDNIGVVDDGEVQKVPIEADGTAAYIESSTQDSAAGHEDTESEAVKEKETAEAPSKDDTADVEKKPKAGNVMAVVAVAVVIAVVAAGVACAVIFYRKRHTHKED